VTTEYKDSSIDRSHLDEIMYACYSKKARFSVCELSLDDIGII
jgi:hypothetical protein